ncbi:MAG: hypothetical protein ABI830_08795 [Pseudolabrys sp.]
MKRKRKPRFKLSLGKRGYNILLNIAKVAGVVSLIYGAGFGIFQYIESKKDKRVEQSFALFRQFNTAPFTEYRKNINNVVGDNSSDIVEAASDEAKLTVAMVNIVQKGKIGTDLVLVMDFFDGVVYCAAKNICDPNISGDLFYARGRELYTTFYQYIIARRSSFAGNDFGAGLETLVRIKSAREKTAEKK